MFFQQHSFLNSTPSPRGSEKLVAPRNICVRRKPVDCNSKVQAASLQKNLPAASLGGKVVSSRKKEAVCSKLMSSDFSREKYHLLTKFQQPAHLKCKEKKIHTYVPKCSSKFIFNLRMTLVKFGFFGNRINPQY
ncbi:hypothetical protein CDAR_91841 [Caerostris darwini]|uniref:Uncharacterized protein n=1 Tax=Caerostris darwini TaxID=1538125 RepID=A0AAV4QKI3_9ARAC|nr:hypothetical protein CDAR_91841 [Caerostris darwini]